MWQRTPCTASRRARVSRSSTSTSSAEASSPSIRAVARRVDVLGVGFDKVDLGASVDRVLERHAAGQRTLVITANPEFVMLARHDPELARIARDADIVVADGTGILLASRLLGDPLPARVPGRVRLPPGIVHALGFEWLWRLTLEPRRWRRQRVLPLFVAHVLVSRARRAR